MGMRDEAMDDMFRRFMSARAMSITPTEDCTPPVNQPANSVQPWTSENYRESVSSLSCLETVTIPELSLRNHHCGRVLYGQFGIEPSMSWSRGWSFNDVVTVLVDTNANAMRVIMSKHLWDTAPMPERDYCFALGKRVAIKDPLLEKCSDGVFAVRLINPGRVICLENVNKDGESLEQMNDATLLEELQKIRLEGNRLFAEKNWAAAVNKYTECINQTLCTKLSDIYRSLHKTRHENSSHFLMLASSNRAEARLRLLHYEDALSDVENALELEPTDVKTLTRKGRAAHGLGFFDKACKAFKAALAKLPEEPSIVKDLKASTTALKQSRTGKYDLSDYFLRGGEVPCCADFVGPVEIRRVGYGRGRRGLFATRNLKPGEHILLSNPLAVFRENFSFPQSLSSNTVRNLILEVHKRIRTSKRQMAQLYSLCGTGMDEMEIPSMDLFRAGSELLPEGEEKTETDAEHISKIVQFNLLGCDAPKIGESFLGVWALPSFANHSCSPNIFRTFIGDAISFRASEHIAKGGELTISYLGEGFPVSAGTVKGRQAEINKSLDFTCKCARCLWEENLKPKLSKMINEALLKLSFFVDLSVQPNILQSVNESMAMVAEIADQVERVILSQCSKLDPKEHGWIRGLFVPAYSAKFWLHEGDLQSTMSALRLFLNSITGICVGPNAMSLASTLLVRVEQNYSKRSKIYTLTLDQLLRICKVCFGEQPKVILQKLIMKAALREVLFFESLIA